MKTLAAVVLALLLVGCESKEDRARAAVFSATEVLDDALRAGWHPVAEAELDRRLQSALEVFPAESGVRKDIALAVASIKAGDFDAARRVTETLKEQFRPKS